MFPFVVWLYVICVLVNFMSPGLIFIKTNIYFSTCYMKVTLMLSGKLLSFAILQIPFIYVLLFYLFP